MSHVRVYVKRQHVHYNRYRFSAAKIQLEGARVGTR